MRPEQEASGKKAGETDDGKFHRIDSASPRWLQNIRSAALCAVSVLPWSTMRLRRTIREVTYHFEDLRDLLAKASPYRSGDELAGIAAESGEQRARGANGAGRSSPAVPFCDQALVPYESDEVTRLILDTHDPIAFLPLSTLTVGDFRDWLLSDARDRRDANAAV